MTTTISADNGSVSGSAGLKMSSDSSGVLALQTGANSTAMTLDASGNVGIGTTSPAADLEIKRTGAVNVKLQVTSAYEAALSLVNGGGSEVSVINAGGSNVLSLRTNNTERMRIDSSGNLLVGKTSTAAGVGEKFGLTTSTDNAAIYITPTNASYSSTIVYINTTRAASAGFDFYGGYANSVGQFRVTGSGTIFAQNTSVQSISDKRLKENIQDATDGLEVITALRPVRYDWKTGYGNDRKNQLGFIAQEVEAVFPEAVSEWQVNKEDETAYKTVGPSAFIPVLVKAIQELKAINDTQAEELSRQAATINAQSEAIASLTARVVALEGK